MIYLQLFFSYLKIGFFGFGGGYSMLSLIHNEVVVQNEWITSAALSDIVAISQMTPGPIAINSATYIGYTVAGFWGAVIATFGVCLPSLTIMVLITKFFLRLKGNHYLESIMATMKPVVLAMIGAASLLLIFPADKEAASMIDAWSWILFILAFIASLKRFDPIRLIVLSAVAGIAIYYLPTLYAQEPEPITIEAKMFEGYDLSDEAIIQNRAFEQTFVDYLYIIGRTDTSSASASLKSVMQSAATSRATTLHLATLGERYLYNSASAMRNDELFIPILEEVIACDKITEMDKLRAKSLLERASRNRVNHPATDFEYDSSTLYAIEARHTLLYFNNPDCGDCARVSAIIAGDRALSSLQEKDILAIVKINPDIDEHINQLYDIKALPTLYLLDSDKSVILKDTSIEKVIEYLQSSAK